MRAHSGHQVVDGATHIVALVHRDESRDISARDKQLAPLAGAGTAMMKMVIKQKNVQSLPELIDLAREQGVRLVACTMSMDVMGIKREELIDGIEEAGVATYLGSAETADTDLFI